MWYQVINSQTERKGAVHFLKQRHTSGSKYSCGVFVAPQDVKITENVEIDILKYRVCKRCMSIPKLVKFYDRD